MDCPAWVPASHRARLLRALAREPAVVAADALADLEALSASWDAAARAGLLERFAIRAEAGAPPPAALVLALNDLLGATQHE